MVNGTNQFQARRVHALDQVDRPVKFGEDLPFGDIPTAVEVLLDPLFRGISA